MVEPVRIGLVGVGNIGAKHLDILQSGAIEGAVATAAVSSKPHNGLATFGTLSELIAAGAADALVISTPTHTHQALGLEAMSSGLHLLMEKPLAKTIGEAVTLVDAVPQKQVAAVMLNQRWHPVYRHIKQLLNDGAIGTLQRVQWSMTPWYRPDVYFRVSSWRGTWAGEGGGLLVNQCIHNIDILQWLTGLPVTVQAFASFGKYHDIEVEDEITAYLSYQNGATGVLIASTGEAPGINQLDLVGDLGTIRSDGNGVTLERTQENVRTHSRETMDMFGSPTFTSEQQTITAPDAQHVSVLRNFVGAIRGDTELEVPLSAGLASLELANAMLLSAWRGAAVVLPLDVAGFEAEFAKRTEGSALRAAENLAVNIDMEQSFR